MRFTRILILTLILISTIIVIVQYYLYEGKKQNEKMGEVTGFCTVVNVSMLKSSGNLAANITFDLPTPCHKLSVSSIAIKNREINLFFALTPPKNPCIQVIKQISQTINLGKLSGRYQLKIFVNGYEVWNKFVSV